VTFLDFGLVKRWMPGELETLAPILDAILDHDPERTVKAMVEAGFLRREHAFDAEYVYDYVSGPYVPFLDDHFTYSRKWVAETLQKTLDIQGSYGDLIRSLNMPTSYVILDRVVWGMSALLGRMKATGNFRALLAEYREDAPPSTELGDLEAEWRRSRSSTAVS